MDRFHEASPFRLSTSSPRNGLAAVAGGARHSVAMPGVSKDGSLHAAVIRGHPSRRIAYAMLLRMRSDEDAGMVRTSETLI